MVSLNLEDIDGLHRSGNHSEAAGAVSIYLNENPVDPRAWAILASCHMNLGDHGSSAKAAQMLTRLEPCDPTGWFLLANGLQGMGHYADALPIWERAIQLAPNWPMALWCRSFALRGCGYWEQGYRDMAYGMLCGQRTNHLPGPYWDGTPIPGKVLMIAGIEGGFGDFVFNARWFKEVKRRSQATVILRVKKELYRLACLLEGPDAVIIQPEENYFLEHFDYSISTENIPPILGIKEPFWEGPFIPSETVIRDKGLRVGLALAGNGVHLNDRNRSVPRETWEILKGSANFVAIQPGVTEDWIEEAPPLNDWEASRIHLSGLDLVVTVDTGVAHLAAAMGLPVWLMTPLNGEWRWGLTSEKTAWYPSVKLYRSEMTENGFVPVLETVAKDLKSWTSSQFPVAARPHSVPSPAQAS